MEQHHFADGGTDFSQIDISGDVFVLIQSGSEDVVTIKTEGEKNIIEYTISEGVLQINGTITDPSADLDSDGTKKDAYVEIKVRELKRLNLTGRANVMFGEFQCDGEINLYTSGNALLGGKLESQTARLELIGDSQIILFGKCQRLYTNLKDKANLRIEDLSTEFVDVRTSGTSVAVIFAESSVYAEARNSSGILIQGNPKEIEKNVFDNAAILI